MFGISLYKILLDSTVITSHSTWHVSSITSPSSIQEEEQVEVESSRFSRYIMDESQWRWSGVSSCVVQVSTRRIKTTVQYNERYITFGNGILEIMFKTCPAKSDVNGVPYWNIVFSDEHGVFAYG